MKFQKSTVVAAIISIFSSTAVVADNVAGDTIIINGDVRFNGSAANNKVTINKITETKTIDVSEQFKKRMDDVSKRVVDTESSVAINRTDIGNNSNKISVIEQGLELSRDNLREAQIDNRNARTEMAKHLSKEGVKAVKTLDSEIREDASKALDSISRRSHLIEVNLDSISEQAKTNTNSISDLRDDIVNAADRVTGHVRAETDRAIEDAVEVAGQKADKRIDQALEQGKGKVGEYVDNRMNTALTHGKEYVDDKLHKVGNDFEEANRAMQVAVNQITQNHQHIGENRQRIEENRAAIEDAKNSGRSAISEADIAKAGEYVDGRMNAALSHGKEYVDDKLHKVGNDFEEASRVMQVAVNQITQNHQHIGENRQRIEENRAAIEDAKNSGRSAISEADIAKAGEYVDGRMNAALSHGKEYVDDKFHQVDSSFEEANRAMQVAVNQITQNHQHIGENRQRIEENRAAIEDAKNSGGSTITEADIKAAQAEANRIASNVANKAIEDAVNNVVIDDETVKAAEAEIAKVAEKAAEKAIADAVSKIDTDKAVNDFIKTLNDYDKEIRGDASKAYTQLDGRIDANTKAIKELDDRVSVLENQIHGFKDMVNNNAAMTNALSALPQPYGVGKVQVGVGFGFADDANAVAVGAGYRVNERLVIRAGVSKSAGNSGSIQGNVGVGFEF